MQARRKVQGRFWFGALAQRRKVLGWCRPGVSGLSSYRHSCLVWDSGVRPDLEKQALEVWEVSGESGAALR